MSNPRRWRWILALAIAVTWTATFAAPEDESENEKENEGPETLIERILWFQKDRLDAKGLVRGDGRNRALVEMEENLKAGLLEDASLQALPGDRWMPIGPRPIEYVRPNTDPPIVDTYSGRVTAIAPHPILPGTAYLGGAQGGVWKTGNYGANWVPLTDTANSLAIGSLAIDPSAPTTIYAGTGEANFSCTYFGTGILKSTDAGTTWTLLGATQFANASVGAILVHPKVPSTLWAAAARGSAGLTCADPATSPKLGVWKSTNGGSTWELVLDEGTLGAGNSATALAMDSGNLDHLYAAVSSSGIWKTTNGGKTWTRLQGGLPAPAAIGRVAVATDPTTPGLLYAVFSAPNGTHYLGRVYKSNDGGGTWTWTTPSFPAGCGNSLLDFCTYAGNTSGGCWYHLVLAVAPDHAVWLGGIGLWRSPDEGATWESKCGTLSHVDHHAIAFKDGNVWVGNDGGAFASSDSGASWASKNHTLGLTQFYPGASLHPSNLKIALGGTQDNASLRTAGTESWRMYVGGDGAFTAVDPVSPNTTWYMSTQNLNIVKTTDGGKSYLSKINGLTEANTGHAAFIAPFVMCPNDRQVLIAGTDNVWRTNDGATTWSANSNDLQAEWVVVRSLAFAKSTGNCTTYFAGTEGGRVYRTTDSGANWTPIATTLPATGVTDLAVHPSDANVVLATVGGFGHRHLWRTTNALAVNPSWASIDPGIPDTPATAILIDPTDPTVLYLGTDVGVFRSANNGTSWAAFNAGHPRVAVFDLQANAATKTVVSFTYGRGAFRLTSPCDDQNLCTNDWNDPVLGCQHAAVDCTDGLACTLDDCNPVSGCTHTPTNSCSDGDPCTIGDRCEGTTCVPGSGALPPAATFCAGAPVSIPDSGAANPYPSTVNVAGQGAYLCSLWVDLRDLTHTYPDNVDLMLEHAGLNSVIFSDVGGATPVTDLDVTLWDPAASNVPDDGPLVAGTYRPTDIQTIPDAFPAPAPAPQSHSTLGPFTGGNPNGPWRLWAVDPTGPDVGTLGDWCVNVVALCGTDAECEDGNPCTTDRCERGGCLRTPNSNACDDGNACTSGDACRLSLGESFELTEVPALPSGWSTSGTGTAQWVTASPGNDGSPNAAFANCSSQDGIGDKSLVSTGFVVPSAASTLTFRHRYKLHPGYDGAVLEISVDGGAFNDITAAGGAITAGNYTGTIQPWTGPLAGRWAWTGESVGYPAYHTVVVSLPAAAAGHSAVLRWRVATNGFPMSVDEWVDSVQVSDPASACAGTPLEPWACDDGNACTDDVCLPESGCGHANSTGFCSDGDSCGTIDQCVDGVCMPTPPPTLPAWSTDIQVSKTQLAWAPSSGATGYDLVRGDLGLLRSTAGDFAVATTACLADDLAATAVDEGEEPAQGAGLFYLLRGTNCSGSGTYDTAVPYQVASRDAEIDAAAITCGTSCGRDKCIAGPAIDAGCGGCVASICAVDPYCCATAWDGFCMEEVRTVCSSLICAESAGACAHTACSLGGPLAPGCDDPPVDPSCVSSICAADPFCCDVTWDAWCVAEVSSLCGMNCQ